MARHRLEQGGSTVSTCKQTKAHPDLVQSIFPVDIDPVTFAQGIRARLGVDEADDALWPRRKVRWARGGAAATCPASATATSLKAERTSTHS